VQCWGLVARDPFRCNLIMGSRMGYLMALVVPFVGCALERAKKEPVESAV